MPAVRHATCPTCSDLRIVTRDGACGPCPDCVVELRYGGEVVLLVALVLVALAAGVCVLVR
jgi:hypothetical protein